MFIKYLAEDDKPREKFMLKGRQSVSDAELLAIIMGSGNRDESAVELARRILNSVGNNWHELSKLSILDLMKFKGIGQAKAISIATALEIGRRRASQEIIERKSITSPKEAYEIFKPHIADLQVEEFWAIYVNSKNAILHIAKLSSGGINTTLVDIRILFKIALEHFATGVFVAHNHPTGSLVPSEQDIQITKKIKEAGNLLDIFLIDHLIINPNSFYSFADDNRL